MHTCLLDKREEQAFKRVNKHTTERIMPFAIHAPPLEPVNAHNTIIATQTSHHIF